MRDGPIIVDQRYLAIVSGEQAYERMGASEVAIETIRSYAPECHDQHEISV